MNVQPSTSFEATAKFPTGLTGTLGVRITDNEGATTLNRTTAGIAEYPAGSGLYAVTLTSPGTGGQYSIVWDDADGHFAHDDLFVTTESAETVIGTGNLYVTVADLKAVLLMQNAGDYKDTALGIAVNAASRAIDGYKGARYYPTDETRVYTARERTAAAVSINDLVSLTSLTLDMDGDGTYETTWVRGTDFVLDPANAVADGVPFTQITLLPQAHNHWPTFPHAIEVAGTFGWASAPAQVTQAAMLLANRFLTRMGAAPLGIVTAKANEMVALARVGSIDEDAAFLLDQLPGGVAKTASIQLT